MRIACVHDRVPVGPVETTGSLSCDCIGMARHPHGCSSSGTRWLCREWLRPPPEAACTLSELTSSYFPDLASVCSFHGRTRWPPWILFSFTSAKTFGEPLRDVQDVQEAEDIASTCTRLPGVGATPWRVLDVSSPQDGCVAALLWPLVLPFPGFTLRFIACDFGASVSRPLKVAQLLGPTNTASCTHGCGICVTGRTTEYLRVSSAHVGLVL